MLPHRVKACDKVNSYMIRFLKGKDERRTLITQTFIFLQQFGWWPFFHVKSLKDPTINFSLGLLREITSRVFVQQRTRFISSQSDNVSWLLGARTMNWVVLRNVEGGIDLWCLEAFCFEFPSRFSETKELEESCHSNTMPIKNFQCFEVHPTKLDSKWISNFCWKTIFADKGDILSFFRSTAGDVRHKHPIICLFRPHVGTTAHVAFNEAFSVLPRRMWNILWRDLFAGK